jgi:hypothetical protein
MAQIIFYIYYALAAIVVLGDMISPFSDRRSKYWYVLLSAPLVLFASFRPMGMMRDDVFYVNVLNLPSAEYFSKMLSLRDPLFYTVAFLLSYVSKYADLLLYFVGFILFLKLVVLHKLAGRRRLLVLFMYISIYWQLHDLTQLRVSLSAFFFLLFFYSIQTNRAVWSHLSIVASMLSHAQGLLNAMFLHKTPIIPQRFTLGFSALIMILLVSHTKINFADIYNVLNYLLGDPQTSDFNFQFREAIRAYYLTAEMHLAKGYVRLGMDPPIIFVLSVVVHLNSIFSLRGDTYQLPVIRSATFSILVAIFLSWLFSSFSDVQVRFYEYYFLAGLVLACYISKPRALIGVYGLSLAYFIKFNIKWEIWDMSTITAMINGIWRGE